MKTPLKVIITGSTGMVGEGTLIECLEDPEVISVLVINRKPCGKQHPKLKEIIHNDFYNLSSIEDQLSGYNACFFCLGISSVGVSKETYYKVTYTLTMQFGETLSRLNTDMTFCYVSGAGTDSTEKRGSNWARVKGKTENDLMKMPFRKVFAMRPGFIKPLKEQNNAHSYYKYILWIFPLGRFLYPAGFCRLEELAQSMIYLAKSGYDKSIIEGKDIIELA